jgi:hypothetical protein
MVADKKLALGVGENRQLAIRRASRVRAGVLSTRPKNVVAVEQGRCRGASPFLNQLGTTFAAIGRNCRRVGIHFNSKIIDGI